MSGIECEKMRNVAMVHLGSIVECEADVARMTAGDMCNKNVIWVAREAFPPVAVACYRVLDF